MTWFQRLPANSERPVSTPRPRSPAGLAEYGSLYQYLQNRYADIVVLTFAQIEDLLGVVLPASARLEPGWWANADQDVAPSVQTRSWTEAQRIATPNLRAQTVMFERALA